MLMQLRLCVSAIAVAAASGGWLANAAAQHVDFSGAWMPLYHEDGPERLPGPDLGDYTVAERFRLEDAPEPECVTLSYPPGH
jgi:hypothetical protein